MLKSEILELYKYQAKKELVDSFSVIRQDRKSIMLYDFGDTKWILMPSKHPDIKEEDIESFTKYDSSKIMFVNNIDIIPEAKNAKCWKLSQDDKEGFKNFQDACSSLDKDNGKVSLDDPVVYGCFEKGKIVSVSSLWNWGDRLSDIGVLTRPDYRHKGYAKSVCAQLMSETDKLFIWRCDDKNVSSFLLAKELGFQIYGHIYSLKRQ